MPEPPDFTAIAKRTLAEQGVYDDVLGELAIIKALKEVWNARGAADLVAVDQAWSTQDESYETVERAIRSVNR